MPSSTEFQYGIANPGGPAIIPPSPLYARIWQVDWEAIVNSIIELILTPTWYGSPSGVAFGYPSSVPPWLFPQAVIRRNWIRNVDVASDPENLPYGINVGGCGALIAEENIVDISLPGPLYGNGKPVAFYACGSTEFFANQSSAGALNQGYDSDTSVTAYVNELSTNVEDAALLAF